MSKSNRQPKAVSSEKASSILKVSSSVRAGSSILKPPGGGLCVTCGILGGTPIVERG